MAYLFDFFVLTVNRELGTLNSQARMKLDFPTPPEFLSLINPAAMTFNQVIEKYELYFSSVYCQ
jgi:hypothetical protein